MKIPHASMLTFVDISGGCRAVSAAIFAGFSWHTERHGAILLPE
jgi:hypothetical protein